MDKNHRSAYTYALLAILFWSTIATAFSLALDRVSVFMLMFFSSIIAVVSLVVILAFNGKLMTAIRPGKKGLMFSALLGFINPFFYYWMLLEAYSILPAQEALVLNYSWPIALVLLSVPLLKQKMGLISLFYILISFAGVMVIATKGDLLSLKLTNWKGDMLALFSSVAWALYWIFNLKDTREAAARLLWNFLFGIVYIGIAILIRKDFKMPDAEGFIALAWIGLFELGITFYFWLKALSLAPRTDTISGLVYLSPFLSLLFIALILGEPILWSTIAGLILIITGILLNRRVGK